MRSLMKLEKRASNPANCAEALINELMSLMWKMESHCVPAFPRVSRLDPTAGWRPNDTHCVRARFFACAPFAFPAALPSYPMLDGWLPRADERHKGLPAGHP